MSPKNTRTKLTLDQVKHVAQLSRLFFKADELIKFSSQLTKIFEYIDLIGQMGTGGIRETSHPSGTDNVFREDEIDLARMLSQEEALSNAPFHYKGYFRVKAIFD